MLEENKNRIKKANPFVFHMPAEDTSLRWQVPCENRQPIK